MATIFRFVIHVLVFVLQYFHQFSLIKCHSTAVPPLLVVGFDGFRWDYLKRTNTPHFDKFIKEGVHARLGIKNVFPTETLPNFLTLATGLYPESHGVVANEMFDPDINETFSVHRPNPLTDVKYLESGGEPIWVTNQRQNNLAKSGVFMWFGSEYSIKWTRPTYSVPYNEQVPFRHRVDVMVDWFTQEGPINLGMLYFHQPDFTAHLKGVESDDVTNAIKEADDLLGYLLLSLDKKDLLDNMNIIVTSDHGFTSLPRDKLILLDNLIPQSWYRQILEHTPVLSIIPIPGMEKKLYEALKNAADKPDSHFQVWMRDDIPNRFHIKHNNRTTPIIALADLPYSFIINTTVDQFTLNASHGYDNNYQDMHPFFQARGPSFKKNFVVDTFNSVDIYPLMCHLLHLTPAPNNGSMHIISRLLSSHETTNWTLATYLFVLIFISSVGGVFAVAVCRQHRYLKRKMVQNRKTAFQGGIKYSVPSKGAAVVKLLSDDDDDDFDDDYDDAENDVKTTKPINSPWKT